MRTQLQQELRGGVPVVGRGRVVEQLQEVEEEIQGLNEEQEAGQRVVKRCEETIQQLLLEQDEGVWRVWSASNC